MLGDSPFVYFQDDDDPLPCHLDERKMLERVPVDDGRSYHVGNGLPFNVRAFHDVIAKKLEFGLVSTFKEIATLVDMESGYQDVGKVAPALWTKLCGLAFVRK